MRSVASTKSEFITINKHTNHTKSHHIIHTHTYIQINCDHKLTIYIYLFDILTKYTQTRSWSQQNGMFYKNKEVYSIHKLHLGHHAVTTFIMHNINLGLYRFH